MALLISSARLLLPYLGTFHEQIEETISSAVGAQVEVHSIDAAWHGTGPLLKFRDVRLLSGEDELLNFEGGSVGIDLWQSLRRGTLQFGNLVVSGVELEIFRDEAGKIGVVGFEAAAAQQDTGDEQAQRKASNEQALLRWLFAQQRIAIESSDVTWRDLKQEGRELHFSNVEFELRNQGRRHQLDGAAELPIHLGRTLSFALDIEDGLDSDGDLIDSDNSWKVHGYVEGGALQLAQWMEGRTPSGIRVDDGQVEARLWVEWQGGALQRAEGELSLRQLLLTPVGAVGEADTREPMNIELISGAYAWQRQAAGWSLAIDNFMLGRENRMWPPSQLGVAAVGQFSEELSNNDEQIIEARIGYARIDDLNALLQMSDVVDGELRQKLQSFAPMGELRDGYLHFRRATADEQERYVVAGRFEDAGIAAVGKLPGASGVDGSVRVDSSGGYLSLKSEDAMLSFPRLFRDPLTVTQATGDLYWQSNSEEWKVESRSLQLKNEDAEVALALALREGEASPVMALLAEFNAPSIANTSRYLPVGIMPQASVNWLDRAIVDGDASAGQAIFLGPFNRFPYDDSDGLFDIRFNLVDGILDYAPGWPRLEEIEAEVIFSGGGMAINGVAARSLNADVTEVAVRIDDFRARPALLEIDGRARGHAGDTLDFVRRSPLNKRFGTFAEGVEVTAGRSLLDLSLDLPLAKLPAKVNGTVRFEAADFYLADRAVDILDVHGDLRFSETGIEIETMQTRLLGMAAALHATTKPASQGGDTVIVADGSASATDVRRLLSNSLLQHLDGEAAWQAQLTIPARGAATDGAALKITSDLKGMAAALPFPLGKRADQSEALVVETRFPRALDIPLQLQYGSLLRGLFDVDETMGLQRGAITLGGATPQLPENFLLQIDGKLPHLTLDGWVPLIEAVQKESAGRHTTQRAAVEIGRLSLEIERAAAFGHDFHYTSIDMERHADVWQGEISNHLMGGQLTIPTDFARDSLVMALDYLIMPGATEEDPVVAEGVAADEVQSNEEADPRRLPSMKIDSRYFSYAMQPLGTLQLLATRRQAGLHVDRLQLSSALMEATASGDWVAANDEQHSSFNIRLKSDDLGELLSASGFADTLRKGESEFGIIARWPGAPMAFALERLSGNMHLKVEDGRLLNVEPGAGRIFGLISLQALPRRLTLDFSDMFRKGFSFDLMEGDFVIDNGDATTENFRVVGPSATITTTGRVGLAANDYDQYVVVEPHVGSSLPMVGAVVSSLGAGVVIWAAQKLLKLDEVAQVKYRVTGPWEMPVVTREEVVVFDKEAE